MLLRVDDHGIQRHLPDRRQSFARGRAIPKVLIDFVERGVGGNDAAHHRGSTSLSSLPKCRVHARR